MCMKWKRRWWWSGKNSGVRTLRIKSCCHSWMTLDELHNPLKNGSISSFTKRVTVTVTSPLTYCANNMQDLAYKNCSSVQFSSVTQSCLTPWITACRPPCPSPTPRVHSDSIHHSVHRVSDAIQPSHPLSSPSPPAPNPSQHQSLFQWVNSLHEVAKVLEFQLQHHSLQRNPRADLL